jgi:hypothetical protein
MLVERDTCNNVPKRTKLNTERQDFRKRKAKEKAQENKISQASKLLTDPSSTPILYIYNQANVYFQKNFIGKPFGYACDIFDKLLYIND